MDLAFYAAATGASAQQKRMNVVANNLSNLQTVGFKKEVAIFANLVYNELNPPAQEGPKLSATSGAKIDKTNTDYAVGDLTPTGMPYDYVIVNDGFFALQDPETQEITYTRDGAFYLSEHEDGRFLLTSTGGKNVLDTQGQVIEVTEGNKDRKLPVGVYRFRTRDGLLHVGNNEYLPTEKNGEAVVAADSDLLTLQGCTEASNVEMAEEMTRMIEAQRAYQLALKVVQTSDEIESTINSLR